MSVGEEVIEFKGIPYAAPPVGELRWREPQPVEPWSGVRAATEHPPACPQTDGLYRYQKQFTAALGGDPSTVPEPGSTDEDCLYLNVWTPALDQGAMAPVMVWLHGDAYVHGSASTDVCSGAELARLGVVVVTVNYRLGPLGFLAHPQLSASSPRASSGNCGILDQFAALEWVQRNIAAFGGDSEGVTVFGESAGGRSVLYLLTSQLTEAMMAYRVRFAATGDPNREGLPVWSAYSPETDTCLELGTPIRRAPMPDLEACALLEAVLQPLLENG